MIAACALGKGASRASAQRRNYEFDHIPTADWRRWAGSDVRWTCEDRGMPVPAAPGGVVPSAAPASEHLFARAGRVTPGGVNSPVRAFRAVGGVPRFMVSGKGAYLTDADGRTYVDLVCSWGPMIFGT